MRISDWSSDVCSSDLKWHDGEPFTAADVKCTWDLVAGLDGKKLRKSPRAAWYNNLESVTADGTMEATFHLKRAQPPFLALLASGWSAVYPCHVPPATMRPKPLGTGPFKVGDFSPNDGLPLRNNPDYRSEERRVGKEWVSTYTSRGAQY